MKHIHFHLIVISSVFLAVDSCQNKKSTSTASSSTQQQTATTTSTTPATTNTTTQVVPQSINTTAPPKQEATTRFIASFYSIGQGIDGKLNEEFVKFLDSYPKKIAYEKKSWGREGESDYCIALKELQDYEQEEFVRKAKKILSTNVNVNENASCTHKKTDAEEKYRFVVSFTSIGEGINLEANKSFEKFVASFTPKVKFELITWGREGEKDYCFKLTELTDVQQDEFVRKAKEVATKKVHIKENEKCVH